MDGQLVPRPARRGGHRRGADGRAERGGLGFDGRHSRFHIYRSILEALAMTIHDTTERMAEELGTSYREVIVSGGGARSDLMMQIHADVHGIPARRAEASSAAGLGAAVCAAVGLGVYADFEEAVTQMVRPGEVFLPDRDNHDLYRRLEAVYRDVRDHTDALYRRTHDIFG
ncbi:MULTISPECIES: FGGY-family carbohydrate kinase [unclassified Streptomyces]|uniref:FGGY-family carbohydrate kinase n=1 Tax=unclassified Streptomyces TaxID=2593676 RepID=UPI003076FC14